MASSFEIDTDITVCDIDFAVGDDPRSEVFHYHVTGSTNPLLVSWTAENPEQDEGWMDIGGGTLFALPKNLKRSEQYGEKSGLRTPRIERRNDIDKVKGKYVYLNGFVCQPNYEGDSHGIYHIIFPKNADIGSSLVLVMNLYLKCIIHHSAVKYHICDLKKKH